MNVFSSCLIFISLLNPLFSHGLDVTSPKDYMSTGSGGFSVNGGKVGCSHCAPYDATGCQPSAGASAPSRRTCDQRFEPTKQGILCESTCDNPKFKPYVVRYTCTAKASNTPGGCTGCA
ncbi:hypothetical protein MJO29_013875 [Puccinia striiformis f. sp. tritici]|uniref:hypothetical protein n=1 Tax=Puccinia striiformis f. sp. tritici TaxID=168172 RepID=UPI002008E4CE|nr:hypothetical protein Pst134EA_025464 [Puccinia striiformis f. sp. tritici]KAI9613018.1 hypothetical protein H4Q26_010289 [Puccinia striiformis f. sp. tritici PST-130]KAH9443701.1 hypothetical protein Pst134EB_026099 [Puccinia striiformis f. sp. tritici]KAH9451512.1 hypothetical protein Pst134EA_025464 [Puccinia striiformis f. sp. tritici]KAI7941801.1 hypothetical protein MJO29_013875 [Puccinia striiformis f. sp. tritici]KAI9627214.1 hypothetical protein KEM48_009958 [Puccinia striiformis f.